MNTLTHNDLGRGHIVKTIYDPACGTALLFLSDLHIEAVQAHPRGAAGCKS